MFTTPSIVVTSMASFLSFMSAAHPEKSKDISLTVGFLGTLDTILTALQQAYKFDIMAEQFRSAAAEYRLLVTRVTSLMRKDRVWKAEWDALW